MYCKSVQGVSLILMLRSVYCLPTWYTGKLTLVPIIRTDVTIKNWRALSPLVFLEQKWPFFAEDRPSVHAYNLHLSTEKSLLLRKSNLPWTRVFWITGTASLEESYHRTNIHYNYSWLTCTHLHSKQYDNIIIQLYKQWGEEACKRGRGDWSMHKQL